MELSLLPVLLVYPGEGSELGPLVGVVELDLVLRPESDPTPTSVAPEGMIDSSSSSLPELSGEELLLALGPPAFDIPFLCDPFVPAREERRPRTVLPPGEWLSVVAAAGEDDIFLHCCRGIQQYCW